jgi:hypothetical protein
LHGEKENFEEYSLILEFAELSFPSLNNYSADAPTLPPGYGIGNTTLNAISSVLVKPSQDIGKTDTYRVTFFKAHPPLSIFDAISVLISRYKQYIMNTSFRKSRSFS